MKLDYQLRDSQKKCVEFSKNYIEEHDGEGELLWNCKMRFGKCFTSLSFALVMGYKKVLIMTHMPAVMNEWKQLVTDHTNFEGWKFYSYKTDDKKIDINSEDKMIVFCSNQLYYTRRRKGATKIDLIKWDLVIIDEMHIAFDEEGEPSKFVSYTRSFKGKNGRNAAKQINRKVLLNLTGTPLNAINNGMYTKEQIYTYSYIDEMRNAEVSDAVRMTMRLPELPFNLNIPDQGFNCLGEPSKSPLSYLNPFLHNRKTGEYEQIFNTNDNVIEFLVYLQNQTAEFEHSIWVLETEQSCLFVKKLLTEHHLFKDCAVKIVAGDTESAGGEFLKNDIQQFVNKNNRTICMTVHKGLTGITIPQWDSVVWLSETTSPKKYFQANFRCQSSMAGKAFATVMDFNKYRAIKMIDGYLNTFQNIPVAKRASEFLKEFYVYDCDGERIDLDTYYDWLETALSKDKKCSVGSYRTLRHGEEMYRRLLKDFKKFYATARKINVQKNCVDFIKHSDSYNEKDAIDLKSYQADIVKNFDRIANNNLVVYVKEKICSLDAFLPEFLEEEGYVKIMSLDVIENVAASFQQRFGISYAEFKYLMDFGLVKDEKVVYEINKILAADNVGYNYIRKSA